jgi:predicted Zn-dependent protease with MMP-like domain
VTRLKDNTIGLLDASTHLVISVETEYEAIKNFKSRPEWKNRVISVPKAIENITALAQVPSQVATAIKDLIQQVRSKVSTEAFNVDELEGIEDLRGLFTRLGGRLAQGFEKILGIVAIIVDALVTCRATIDDLQSIVDAIKTVRQDLENLDGFFLTQKNPRKLLRTQDGETFNIRVGSLHSS